jgi:hypothetical protein
MTTFTHPRQKNNNQLLVNRSPVLESESNLPFIDNRPQAIAQRKMQEAADNSSSTLQLKAYQEMANNSTNVKQWSAPQVTADPFTAQTVQRQENVEKQNNRPPEAQKMVQQKQESGTETKNEQSSLRFLKQNNTNNGNVVQRAGPYAGLMLPHEDVQGIEGSTSYGHSIAENQSKNTNFTYHHIVPENKLVRLGKMIMRFETLFGIENPHSKDISLLKVKLRQLQEDLNTQQGKCRMGDEVSGKVKRLERREGKNSALQTMKNRGWDIVIKQAIDAALKIKELERQILEQEAKVKEKEKELKLTSKEETTMNTGNRRQDLKDLINTLVSSTKGQVQEVKNALLRKMQGQIDDATTDAKKLSLTTRKEQTRNADLQNQLHPDYGLSFGFSGIAWIPGNIHRGPSKGRIDYPTDNISPTTDNVSNYRNNDDGGDRFEYAAINLLDKVHYDSLYSLSNELEAFQDNEEDTGFDEARIDQFIKLITKINEIRSTYPNIHSFNLREWEQVRVRADGIRETKELKETKDDQTDLDYTNLQIKTKENGNQVEMISENL